MLRGLTLFLLMSAFSSSAWSLFNFDQSSIRLDELEITATSPDVINYQFSVKYESFGCIWIFCARQSYSLGFADNSITDPNIESWFADFTTALMSGAINFSDDQGGQGRFFPGAWSGKATQGSDGENLTGSITMRLRKSELINQIENGATSVSFYLVGREIENTTRDADAVQITLPISMPLQARISGLKDLTLSDTAPVDQMNACIYNSRPNGQVRLEFDSASNPGQEFRLGLSGKNCSDSENCLNYTVDVSQGGRSKTYSEYQDKDTDAIWQGTDDIDNRDCGNLTIAARLNSATSTALPGVYSDTMTVTVIPE
ncbi:hypothetical protein [Parendozoicomonas haliclonae]|uniref:Spore coat protein U domain-containing protein n=1 Tax=Parendozoicomonas haliclonae TaxID=1960125 RepID=A0A1X7AG46_9GAMM|nr:hypothetical protein [Parendozoicomonas haliclonae]SMA39293.1 hypothetical protein EHSB41UT_01005 [Parendozoicomonas haliclonae]